MLKHSGLSPWQLLSFVAVLLLAACAGQPGEEAAFGQPLASPNDSREYRFVELDNGLRALLISDPDADKAAASLDVFVGSAQNPADRGGLAHFLEHMLFLGTDKYPDPAEYEQFISEHGGHRNAYTAFEHTNYYFDVDYGHLAGALDRFAQFFVAPRFDAEYVDREVKSVEAEYQMGLKTDPRRNLDVFREVVNPEHPFSILGVGTRDTLADREGSTVRDELLAFYRQYYSANLMTLAVLGRESLDDLQALVEQGFAAVPNNDVRIPDIDAPLYKEGSLPMQVNIRPEASARELQLSFPLPLDYDSRYRRKSLNYVGFLVGHEGEGSLLSLLKQEGWAEALGAGGGLSYRGGSAFYISINLTESGMAQRDAVLARVFEYLRLLRQQGAEPWLYDEQAQVAALQFRFKEKTAPMGYVSSLSHDMHYFAPRDVLRGNYLMDDFSAAEIDDILQNYLTAENVLVTVIGKDVPVDRESKYYATPYSLASLADAGRPWQQLPDTALDARLSLPAPNPFIAGNVELVEIAAANPAVPSRVLERDGMQLWFRQDNQFRIPKGGIYSSFRSPLVSRSARDSAISRLYVSLLSDAVNEYTYPAHLAGLNFSIYRHSRGISLKVSGYADKQLLLLEDIVAQIGALQVDSSRFENIRADMVRGLENARTERPFRQVMSDAQRLLQHGEFSEEQLLEEMVSLTPAEVEAFAQEFWSGARAEVLVNGNYTAQVVESVAAALAPLLPEDGGVSLPPLKVVKLGADGELVYPAPVEHGDSVVFRYVQAPGDNRHQQAMAALTGQLFKSGFYQQLRTEQQLGYVVSAFYYPVVDVPGIGLLVQSPTTPATAVEQAVLDFLDRVGTKEGMTAAQFASHRTALLNQLRQPHKNLWEQTDSFWKDIARREPGFDTREQLASAVEAIDYATWRAWYGEHMLRKPAAVNVVAPGRWNELPEGQVLESRSTLQSERPFYERP